MPTPEHILAPLRGSTDPDAMLLVQLAETGSDLRKPHIPEFAFEAHTAAFAQAIADELTSLNFEAQLHVPDSDDENSNYWVIAKRTMVLALSVVSELSTQFEALAVKHKASYDGWGAEIVE